MTRVRPLTTKKGATDISIGGCSLAELAKTYGTPLYVLDEATIRNNCQVSQNTD